MCFEDWKAIGKHGGQAARVEEAVKEQDERVTVLLVHLRRHPHPPSAQLTAAPCNDETLPRRRSGQPRPSAPSQN